MITVEILLSERPGLARQDLERWILNDWVRADGQPGEPLFHDIDVARVRLIQELRDDMEVNEAALPVVLLVLDQIYALRRQMSQLRSELL